MFNNVHKNLPKVAGLYYTSKNNFINMYPWVSSTDFSYDKSLQTEEFYSLVTPQNDPLRKKIWTPVYLDNTGKGLVVSLSSPIYKEDEFLGAVSFDISNDLLNEMIQSPYEFYIYDDYGTVIADSKHISSDKDVIKINELLKCSNEDIKDMEQAGDFQRDKQTRFYTYSVAFKNSDLKMLIRVPISTIIFKTQLYFMPIFIMCVLFLIIYFQVEKRKKSELQLEKSLAELTSYHTLLENAAKYDFLTSTVNRRGFMETFNKNIDSNCESNTLITLIMSDIDFFKKINDTYGHPGGDKVLIDVASILQKNVSENDTVCRWGGEEFLIMLMNRTHEEAMRITENIRREIEAKIITLEQSTKLQVTATFGVADYNYEDNFHNNITKADCALYFGKNSGRNRVVDYQACNQTNENVNM